MTLYKQYSRIKYCNCICSIHCYTVYFVFILRRIFPIYTFCQFAWLKAWPRNICFSDIAVQVLCTFDCHGNMFILYFFHYGIYFQIKKIRKKHFVGMKNITFWKKFRIFFISPGIICIFVCSEKHFAQTET